MGRPKINEKKRRVTISVSVSQDVKELAERSENASRFFERSVNTCRAINDVLSQIGEGKTTKEVVLGALEDIEDLMAGWDAQLEEKMPFEKAMASLDERPRAKTGS